MKITLLRCLPVFFLLLLILPKTCPGAFSEQEDSLRNELKRTPDPCGKAEILNGLSVYYRNINSDSSIHFSSRASELSEECGDELITAAARLNQSVAYDLSGNYPPAVELALKALKIYEKNNKRKEQALVLHTLGKISFHQSENSSGVLQQDYYKEALSYYGRALEIEKSLDDLLGITNNFIEIGRTLFETGNSDSALVLLNQSLRVSEENRARREFLHNIAKSSYNISLVHIREKEFGEAIPFLAKAVEVDSVLNNKEGVAGIRMAEMYLLLGNAGAAADLAKQNLDTAMKYGYELRVLQSTEILYRALAEKGDYRDAFNYLLMNRKYADSLGNEEHVKEITKMEMQYDYDKKTETEKLRHEAEKKQQQLIIYGVVTALVLLFAFLIYGIYTYSQKQKAAQLIAEQKKEVERQKLIVEEKNKEVHDSIVYAKRIQNAILPPVDFFNKCFIDAFVLYKPKDIIAGDFYWLEEINHPTGKEIIFAVADCTGHGVPGAIVSVVCHNALKRSVREYGLTDPGAILDKTREIVIEEFGKGSANETDQTIKDGMDIALCAYHPDRQLLYYSGANNPLWMLRKGELKEIKADKQPVGHFSSFKNFTTHTVEVQEGDSLYIFSDGYADQFGGEKSKKFKASSMRELFLRFGERSMSEQQKIMDAEFEQWKGSFEQIDDVCLIGIRF